MEILKEKKEMLKLEKSKSHNSYNLANIQHEKKQVMSIRLGTFTYKIRALHER